MEIVPSLKKKFGLYKWIALIVFILILVPYLLAGFVLYQLLHPNRVPLSSTPEQFQLAYQNIQFISKKDKTLLKGWLIPAKSSRNIVIFAHGYGDNRSNIKATLPVARALNKQGIASLLFDFRASGTSGGSITTLGMNEKYDLDSAIAFVKAKGYTNIGLMGFSMGAVTVIETAADNSDVKAVIADSAFSDLKPYLEGNLPKWSGLPSFFTPIMLSLSDFTGVNLAEVRPIQSIKQLKNIPLFLIHTKKDPSIPYTESVKLAEVYGNTSALWLTDGNKHVGSYEANPTEYLSRVTQFFEQHMK